MPSASEVQQANPSHLANNTFLVNLAVTFNVVSIPLAIFILIVVLIGCVLFIVAIIFIVRSCIRRKFIPKRKKKPYKSIFLDEVPGAITDAEKHRFGSLEYSLEYNLDKKQLNVNVIQANNLMIRPGVETLDTYVILGLLKEKDDVGRRIGKLYKTSRKKSKHPSWNQSFTFDLDEKELKYCIITFEVFDYDSIGQDYSLGELRVSLKDLDEGDYAGKILERTEWLRLGEPVAHGIGELCVGLSYYPQFGRIDVTIFEARQLDLKGKLSSSKENHISVEVKLKGKGNKHLGSNTTKSKTDIVNPYFNERMSFPFKNGKLEDCSVVCRLCRHNAIGIKKALGYVSLGSTSPAGTGVKQWEEMLKGPSKTHVMWHVLVPKVSNG